jgi:hypothetical protein
MDLAPYAPLIAFALFLAMLVILEAGRRIGIRRRAQDPAEAGRGRGTVEGAVFALLGLLIAFTFSAAAARFDARRALVVEESNDIGTSWLRLDLLPAEAQPPLRDLFRRYLDSRIEVYRKMPDLRAALAELDRSTRLQGEIWTRAVAACRQVDDPATTSLVLSALNDMIDITTTRTWAAQTHTPGIIFVLLVFFALAGSLLAGFAMSEAKERSWLHAVGFSALLAATIYVIGDLEYPRIGLIRLDAMDQVLVDLRKSMN